MKALFETIGMENDPLGLWQPTVSTAATAPGAISFSVGGEEPDPQPINPVFRVNLPADNASASQALAAREDYMLSLNAALENIPSRLDGLVARGHARAHVRFVGARRGLVATAAEEQPAHRGHREQGYAAGT